MNAEDVWEFIEEAVEIQAWSRLLILCDALEENEEEKAAQTLRWSARKGHNRWKLKCGGFVWELRNKSHELLSRATFTAVVDAMTRIRETELEFFSD